MNRLPAFTLLEVVLSLFLLGLVGIYAVQILGHVKQAAMVTSGQFTREQEWLWFTTALRADIERAVDVTSPSPHALVCSGDSGNIVYEFRMEDVQRVLPDGTMHRFALHLDPVRMQLEAIDLHLVRSVGVVLRSEHTTMRATFRKHYAPADRMRARVAHAHPHP
jgi:hypothetical protein